MIRIRIRNTASKDFIRIAKGYIIEFILLFSNFDPISFCYPFSVFEVSVGAPLTWSSPTCNWKAGPGYRTLVWLISSPGRFNGWFFLATKSTSRYSERRDGSVTSLPFRKRPTNQPTDMRVYGEVNLPTKQGIILNWKYDCNSENLMTFGQGFRASRKLLRFSLENRV